jgi:hypothetical protein
MADDKYHQGVCCQHSQQSEQLLHFVWQFEPPATLPGFA